MLQSTAHKLSRCFEPNYSNVCLVIPFNCPHWHDNWTQNARFIYADQNDTPTTFCIFYTHGFKQVLLAAYTTFISVQSIVIATVTAKPTWVVVGSNSLCDTDAGEVYRSQSPGKLPSLESCKKSCQDDTGCESIAFFNSGWCSHFSTPCTKTTRRSNVVSLRLLLGKILRYSCTMRAIHHHWHFEAHYPQLCAQRRFLDYHDFQHGDV